MQDEAAAAAGAAGAAGGDDDVLTLRQLVPPGFHIGAAVTGAPGDMADGAYGETLARQFNSLTPENAGKWGCLMSSGERGAPYSWGTLDAMVDFAAEHNMEVRGHVLAWHSQAPAWIYEDDVQADELRAAIREHIITVVGRYKGRIQRWDVVNEAIEDDATIRKSPMSRLLGGDTGYEWIADCFAWAHEADPDCQLIYNDYSVVHVCPKSTCMFAMVKDLVERRGAPIHAVGFQSHLRHGGIDVGSFLLNVARFGSLGLHVNVSELDVNMRYMPPDTPVEAKLQQQGAAYATVMNACLACRPVVDGLTCWGFTDKFSWITPPADSPNPIGGLPFDEEYRPKPAFVGLVQALAEIGDGAVAGVGAKGDGEKEGDFLPKEVEARTTTTLRLTAESVTETTGCQKQAGGGGMLAYTQKNGRAVWGNVGEGSIVLPPARAKFRAVRIHYATASDSASVSLGGSEPAGPGQLPFAVFCLPSTGGYDTWATASGLVVNNAASAAGGGAAEPQGLAITFNIEGCANVKWVEIDY